jgi:hypothetical protein
MPFCDAKSLSRRSGRARRPARFGGGWLISELKTHVLPFCLVNVMLQKSGQRREAVQTAIPRGRLKEGALGSGKMGSELH